MNEKIKAEIDQSIADCVVAYRSKEIPKAIGLLEHAWDLLPDPKEEQEQSFHIAKYLTTIYLESDNAPAAKEWAAILQHCHLERADSGEREFWAGRAALANGELETARNQFSISNAKSRGRFFQGEDKKYLKV